jgi:hypothetical protein
MNSKKAKAIRKAIRNAQKNQPDLFKDGQEYIENESKRKTVEIEDLDADGNVFTKKVAISLGQLTTNPASQRGLYKQLKKHA